LLTLRILVPSQKNCNKSTAVCLASFSDPSCTISCFLNFSLVIIPDSDSDVPSVWPSSGFSLSALIVSVAATNVLSLYQSVLRYSCNSSDVVIGSHVSFAVLLA
jgi:hypothetical protein